MHSKVYYYLLIVALIALVVFGGIGFYYAAFGDLSFLFGNKEAGSQEEVVQNQTAPQVGLRIDENGKVYLSWKRLPDGTAEVRIYRRLKGNERWRLWKTVTITGNLEQGLIQLQSSATVDLDGYEYYFEVVGAGGESLWTSPPQDLAPLTPDDLPQNNSSQNGGDENTSSQENNSSTPSTPPETPTDNPSSDSPPPSSSNTTSGIPHYRPSGELSGFVENNSLFSVRHVNQKIELVWQNLSENTTQLKIFRSLSSQGPWSVFFTQTSPDPVGPVTIYLLDEAVHTSFYYRLQTLGSAGQIIETIGPVYLPAEN